MSVIRLKIFQVLFILAFLQQASAQTEAINDIASADSTSGITVAPIHALYSGAGFGNGIMYPAITVARTGTFAYGSLLYSFKNELFASVSAWNIMESGQVPDFSNYSLMYIRSMNKWLDISLMASFFQFNKATADTLLNNFAYTDLSAGLIWKSFRTSLSFSASFSAEIQYYVRIKNSVYIQTPSLFRGKAFLSFNPSVTLLAGSFLKAETSVITTPTVTCDTLFVRDTDNFTGYTDNGNSPSSQSFVSIPGSGFTINTVTTWSGMEITALKKDFGIIETNITLPIALNFKRLTLETEPGYIIPLRKNEYMPQPGGFNLTISLLFRLF